jgi:PmbA protein
LNVIAPEVAVGDDSPARLERLADLSQQLLDRARALGASQAEVSCSEDRGLESTSASARWRPCSPPVTAASP